MYYPILRGKQFELIALRELAPVVGSQYMTPVIEPVRDNLSPLRKTVEILGENAIKPLIIVNPSLGDFSGSGSQLARFVQELGAENFAPCVKVKRREDLELIDFAGADVRNAAVLVENGVDRSMIAPLNDFSLVLLNKDKVNPSACSQLSRVVLYGDAFPKKSRNADYEEKSFFSSLHVTWSTQKNVVGFGDFTILGEEYAESGGPAYVVTIHLSYIDNEDFDSMYVRHFSSFDDQSPANPGGKFKDALEKLCQFVEANAELFQSTTGLAELFSLRNGAFPGLGQVKKYSMKHHVETTCSYLRG